LAGDEIEMGLAVIGNKDFGRRGIVGVKEF
jgi:hypothetical protein